MKKYLLISLFGLALVSCTGRGQEEPLKVKNVIFMIGDGMGMPHITALSIDQNYEPLQMERASYIGIQKTYSANNRITDSSAAGTALATGEKTNNGIIGISPDGRELESVLKVAQRDGKATGIVVTYTPTDATPAAFVAHTSDRRSYFDTALQYVSGGVDVIAGTSPGYFNDRPDGRDLIAEMLESGYTFAPDKRSFLNAESTPVLALLPYEDIPYVALDSLGTRGDYLTEATLKAISLLEDVNENGFFLMVESSFIDWAAHDNTIEGIVAEMRDFDRAVGAVFDYADAHPGTLVIVTGDHETGGLTIVSPSDDYMSGDAGLDYRFSTDMHAGSFLPVFAYGTGAENFIGTYENADVARKIKALFEDAKK